MLWVPSGTNRSIHNSGIVGSTTPWTGVPSSATTLNYGTVTELISAANNTQNSWGIGIVITETGALATAGEASVDILIGGATDDVLISSLLCGNAYWAGHYSYLFPIHVPSGVRLAARLASVRTSITPRVGLYLFGGGVPPWRVGRKVTTYGTKINNARGVAVTPAASGAAMTVTQIVASTTSDHFAFQCGLQSAGDTTILNGRVVSQIGTGASTEQIIGHPIWWGKNSEESWTGPFPDFPIFANVLSGTRLTLNTSCSGTLESGYDGHIYAVS